MNSSVSPSPAALPKRPMCCCCRHVMRRVHYLSAFLSSNVNLVIFLYTFLRMCLTVKFEIWNLLQIQKINVTFSLKIFLFKENYCFENKHISLKFQNVKAFLRVEQIFITFYKYMVTFSSGERCSNILYTIPRKPCEKNVPKAERVHFFGNLTFKFWVSLKYENVGNLPLKINKIFCHTFSGIPFVTIITHCVL
jgi:hypothetical protein